jgi:hypothetical protein
MKKISIKYSMSILILIFAACNPIPEVKATVYPTVSSTVEQKTITMESEIYHKTIPITPIAMSLTPTPTPTSQPCPPIKYEKDFVDWDNPEKSIGLFFINPMNWGHYFLFGKSYDHSDPQMFLAELEKGTKGFLWLGKFICVDNRIEYYQDLDVKPLPQEKKNEGIPWNLCKVNSVADKDVFAWGRYEVNNPQLLDIKEAWKVNVKTQRIDNIPAENVKCYVNWSP